MQDIENPSEIQSRPGHGRDSVVGRRGGAGWAFVLILAFWAFPAAAFDIEFEAADFAVNPTFSFVETFSFSISVQGPLEVGLYSNPALNGVRYNVFGRLETTPSGFPAFDLRRTIGGAEFYDQGSSLMFEIDAAADLSDGLQASELVGGAGAFVFDGREVGTGRYHPSLFELNLGGTSLIRNSNNFGGINPGSGMFVDVMVGEEYRSELGFDPAELTLVVPEPSSALLLGMGMGLLARQARRRDSAQDR